jgi:hypothetical protein
MPGMDDSRIVMARWLSLIAMAFLWGSVAISVVGGAGFPWFIAVLAILCTGLAAFVWLRLR